MSFHDADWLFEPHTADVFLREYLDQKPLYLTGRDPQRYATLFSPQDIDRILFEHSARMCDYIAAVKGDVQVSPPRGSEPRLRSWVDRNYRQGSTIQLTKIGRLAPRLAEVQRALEGLVKGVVNINLYITPPNSQGFSPHFDPHDVIVLPLAGRKQWHLYPPRMVLPTPAMRTQIDPAQLGPPLLSPILIAGDLLYLPRGVIHQAHAQDEPTMHLTIGMLPPTWSEVLEECLRSAATSVDELRRSLLATPTPPPRLAGLVAALTELGVWKGEDPSRAALDRISAAFVRDLPPLRGPSFEPQDAAIGLSTRVERVPGMVMHVMVVGAQVRMAFPGVSDADHRLELAEARFMEPAFRFLGESRSPFRAIDLPVDVGEDLKLGLVGRWFGAGLVRRAE